MRLRGLISGAAIAVAACSDPAGTSSGPLMSGATWPVASVSDTANYADLKFLKNVIGNARIVQLGESGHGVAEFDAMKVRLIRYLHEQMGFDVVAFESGLWDCHYADQRADQYTGLQLMRACIFGVWHAQETLPLFDYIKASKQSGRPITLAGMDVQFSTVGSASQRPAEFAAAIQPIDAVYARKVAGMDSALILATSRTNYVNGQGQARLIQDYQDLATFLLANAATINANKPNVPNYASVLAQTARSTTLYIRQLAAPLTVPSFEARDSGMADNVTYLANQLYPNKKIIVWAHNDHIQYDAVNTTLQPAAQTMGHWIAQRHRAETYSIGLYMFQGTAADNSRNVYSIFPPPLGSMEYLLRDVTTTVSFTDFKHQTRSLQNDWMFTSRVMRDWGTQNITGVPHDQYDGVIMVRVVTPPHYI